MKLILFSGEITQSAGSYIKELSNDNPSLTIIPSDSTHPKADKFKNELISCFNKLGIKNIQYYPIEDQNLNLDIYDKSDIIYLSGGDTAHFLTNLKDSGNFEEIKKFVARGGLLIGLSAGSIIMTPNIGLDNAKGEGLNLLDFEFRPHYNAIDDDFLLEYSENSDNIIYALPDESFIVIDGEDIHFVSQDEIFVFSKGYKSPLI